MAMAHEDATEARKYSRQRLPGLGKQSKSGSRVIKEQDLQTDLHPASRHIAVAADRRRAEARWTAKMNRTAPRLRVDGRSGPG